MLIQPGNGIKQNPPVPPPFGKRGVRDARGDLQLRARASASVAGATVPARCEQLVGDLLLIG
jgi:hypothetical protein